MSDLPPRRKKLLILSIFMMAVVIITALVFATHGQDMYMNSEGYFKTCSPLPEGMACEYCKCPNGGGGPGFGSAQCDDGARPICERADD